MVAQQRRRSPVRLQLRGTVDMLGRTWVVADDGIVSVGTAVAVGI